MNFCPILGLQVLTQNNWRGRKLGEHFTANFYIVGQSVLYSSPSGIADLHSTKAVLQLSAEVAQQVSGGTGSYIQIEDYAELSKATIGARKHFIDQMISRDRLMALIFCNLSPMMQFFVKIGERFNTAKKSVYVVQDYKAAITMALRLCNEFNLETGPFVFGKQETYRNDSPKLMPPELLSNSDWDVKTDSYTNRSLLIDRCILHSVSSGFFQEAHVPLIDDMRLRVRENLSSHENLDYIVVDVSALEGGSRKARQLYMQSLKQWYERFPFRLYVMYGANAFMRTAARLANPFMPFKIIVAKNIGQAFKVIQDNKNPEKKEKTAAKSDPIQKYRDELLAYIGGIDWEQEGLSEVFGADDRNHPFHDVFQAIKLIKNEVDDLFKTRRQTQERLEESEKKYRELFENGSDFICTHSLDGTLIDTNLAFKKGYGWDGELPPSRNIRDLIPERYRHRFDDYLDRIKSRGHDEGLMIITTATGREIVLDYNNVLVKGDSGEPIFIQGSARDITDRIEAERESRKLQEQLKQKHKIEAIATLTGGIAHDYNNLLAIIMGNLSIAREETEPHSFMAELLHEAEQASSKARDLTHQLMTLSRGGYPMKKLGAIENLLKEIPEEIQEREGIKYIFSLQDDLWAVEHDSEQMKYAISNVLINAVEAMPQGGRVTIEAGNRVIENNGKDVALPLNTGKYVSISIKDEGRGIPEEHLSRVFDPYFSTKERGVQKGMGLGLAATHAIVQKHGGHIMIDSTIGVETTLTIYLPASEDKREDQKAKQESNDTLLSISRGQTTIKKILVMDDEESLRNLAQKMLERLGYEVETVNDGLEATSKYKQHMDSGEPFDAVILDLTIKGGMGGDQAIKELNKINPDVKAIVCSGYFNDPVMANYAEHGFQGAIAKPYQKTGLANVLKKVL